MTKEEKEAAKAAKAAGAQPTADDTAVNEALLAAQRAKNAKIAAQNKAAEERAQKAAQQDPDSLAAKISQSDKVSEGKLAVLYHHPVHGYFKVYK